jgi:hypothetical protein
VTLTHNPPLDPKITRIYVPANKRPSPWRMATSTPSRVKSTSPLPVRNCRSMPGQASRKAASRAKEQDYSARIAKLRAEVENLADAIAAGALRGSPSIAARLAAAECELERLMVAQTESSRVVDITAFLGDLSTRATRAVDELEKTLASGDLHRARAQIKAQVGTVMVEADEQEIRLYTDKGAMVAALLRAAGSSASSCGSGGLICISHSPDFIDILLR